MGKRMERYENKRGGRRIPPLQRNIPKEKQKKNTSFLDALKKKNLKINVAVFGVDGDGTRTDVMFVVHFDSEEQRTSLVSMPRDTRVKIASDVVSYMEKESKYYQSPTKLNAVHAYAGKEKGPEMTENH